MSKNQSTSSKPTFNNYTIESHGIIKGFTRNAKGTFFTKISLPTGEENSVQSFINIDCVVSKSPALQAIANSLCNVEINEGKGTRAFVTLSNMKADHSFDADGNIQCSEQGLPFINYRAFLNGIAFS